MGFIPIPEYGKCRLCVSLFVTLMMINAPLELHLLLPYIGDKVRRGAKSHPDGEKKVCICKKATRDDKLMFSMESKQSQR